MADAHLQRLRQLGGAYRDAFWQHIRDPGEVTLRTAYELGREAITQELSVLDIAAIHHETLVAALREVPSGQAAAVTESAAEFFQEALSAAEMVRRGYREALDAELRSRQRATVVRRLSSLLSDSSLAAAGDDTIAEILQLAAEHARELANADRVAARLHAPFPRRASAPSSEQTPNEPPDPARLVVPLLALDGSRLGQLELWRSGVGFSPTETASVAHLAEMVSAAIDRTLLYRA